FPRNLRTELRLSGNNLLYQDALTDGIVVGKILLCHHFVDHGGGRRSLHVAVAQGAAFPHRYAERKEIGRTHHLKEAASTIGAVENRLARNLKGHPVAPAPHW